MELLEARSSEDEDEDAMASIIRSADTVDLVLLPPQKVDTISDVEDIDEDDQVISDVAGHVPGEMAGEIEVVCEYNEGNNKIPKRPDDYELQKSDAENDADSKGESPPNKKKEEI